MGAQLPMLVRGFYYEGWNPRQTPVSERKRDAFLRHVSDQMRDDGVDSQQVTRAVFAVLAKHVTEGEIEDVRHGLPASIRSLWT